MKIMHVVGNRPQFIKLAPVSRKIQGEGICEAVIHTGQHYDRNMSDIFFEELEIPKPKVNLNVGSGTHAQVTAKVMERLEEVVLDERPDGVVIYGDTNSTLAAAIVVSKLNIPLFHVEAGPRTFARSNPEEQNRVAADHLSDYLFAPDALSADNLKKEGIDPERIIFSGDVMYDQFLYSVSRSDDVLIDYCPDDFILMTWHRQENTCSRDRMEKMLSFMEKIEYDIVFPMHPRTRKLLHEYGLWQRVQENRRLIVTEPVGYKEMTVLLSRCRLLISDSGGASKEASFAGKKCFFTLNLEVWLELVQSGHIKMVDIEDEKLVIGSVKEIRETIQANEKMPLSNCFGNGNAAQIIADVIKEKLAYKN